MTSTFFMSAQQGSRLTYSSVHTALPRDSRLSINNPSPLPLVYWILFLIFALQNCPERVVLSAVSKNGTRGWTSQNIVCHCFCPVPPVKHNNSEMPPSTIHTWPAQAHFQSAQGQKQCFVGNGESPCFWQASSPELHTAEVTSDILFFYLMRE